MKSRLKLSFILLSFVLPFGLAACDTGGGGGKQSASLPGDEEGVAIHYHRADGMYDNWALWLWEAPSGEGVQYAFNGEDDYGAYCVLPFSTWENVPEAQIGFIVKAVDSWTKDIEADRFLDFTALKKEGNLYHAYLESGDENIYLSPDKEMLEIITTCSFLTNGNLNVQTTLPFNNVKVYKDGKLIIDQAVNNLQTYNVLMDGENTADFKAVYEAEVTFSESGNTARKTASNYGLYRTENFDNNYTYDGELGAIYTSAQTTFRVWSPVADKITLNVYNNGTPKNVNATLGSDEKESYEMRLQDRGVYEYVLSGDQAGKYYTYTVYSREYPNGKEIVDPYAKSAGVNGVRGMIVDFSKTNPVGWDDVKPLPYDRKELVVYELHVADLTSDDTWGGTNEYAKTFKGFYEEGTKYTEGNTTVTTGFDHIKEMGVNAVQILPFYDQQNDEVNTSFNWGYNPQNYNVLEGSYSTDPYDGYQRIKEFKELVKAYTENDINIIMDVVYNHVSGAAGSNFDVLMPGYYFRYNSDGTLNNGTGVGNVCATEMPMMHKFVVESATFWAEEYKLGGFRFDLMGNIDMETMEAVVTSCEEVNPDIVIYGEPWTGGTDVLDQTLRAVQANGNRWVGYGGFNDQIRDGLIRGGLSAPSEVGWVANDKTMVGNNDLNRITYGARGIVYSNGLTYCNPDSTVNYVTCHDNYTIYDRFVYGNEITDEARVKKMVLLSEAAALLTQGTSFMQGGEEFLRSKGGNSNSYDAGYDVNAFKYDLKVKHLDLVDMMKKIIRVKTTNPLLHLDQDETSEMMTATFNPEGNVVTYEVNNPSGGTLKIAMANGLQGDTTVDFTGYNLAFNSVKYSDVTTLEPYQVVVGVK